MSSSQTLVVENQSKSGVHKFLRSALREAISGGQSSTRSGADSAFHLPHSEWGESEHYQVALVPRGSKADREGTTYSQPLKTPVFLLPLTWNELMRRLRTVVALSPSPGENGVVRFGEVSADFSSMEVSRSEEVVALTAMELKLLRFLVLNAGRIISRNEMLDEVWGYDNYPCTRTVDNHILRLRQKLELDPANPVHFRTVHRVGYKFVLEGTPRRSRAQTVNNRRGRPGNDAIPNARTHAGPVNIAEL